MVKLVLVVTVLRRMSKSILLIYDMIPFCVFFRPERKRRVFFNLRWEGSVIVIGIYCCWAVICRLMRILGRVGLVFAPVTTTLIMLLILLLMMILLDHFSSKSVKVAQISVHIVMGRPLVDLD